MLSGAGSIRRLLALAGLGLATVAFALAAAARSDAYVYWANNQNSIGRANLDGTGVSPTFIPRASLRGGSQLTPSTSTGRTTGAARSAVRTSMAPAPDPASSLARALPAGVAVDGRARLLGELLDWDDRSRQSQRRGANQSFITGARKPTGVTVDGSYVYWANSDAGTIGRADLDGSGVNQAFVTGASFPNAIAVDAANVYWTTQLGTDSWSIGRGQIAGGGVLDETFITGPVDPAGLAVDDANVYWSNGGTGTIGRANIDGSGHRPELHQRGGRAVGDRARREGSDVRRRRTRPSLAPVARRRSRERQATTSSPRRAVTTPWSGAGATTWSVAVPARI